MIANPVPVSINENSPSPPAQQELLGSFAAGGRTLRASDGTYYGARAVILKTYEVAA